MTVLLPIFLEPALPMVAAEAVETNFLILEPLQLAVIMLMAALVVAEITALGQLLDQTTETPVLQTLAVAVEQVAELVEQAQAVLVGQVL